MLVIFLVTLVAVFLVAALLFLLKGLAVRREDARARAEAGGADPRSAAKKRGKRAAPEAIVPVTRVQIADRDLRVAIYHHAFFTRSGETPCWTYVTEGLRAHGQKEVVFTVACRAGEPVDAFPPDPLELAAVLHDLARQGRIVDIGGRTELGDRGPGILGNTALRGILYTPPQLGSFPAPEGDFLIALALTRGELHLAMEQGMVRLLALLGQHHRFYPTCAWIDRDREEIAHVDAMRASILDKMPRVHALTLTVCEEVTRPRRLEREQPEVGLAQLDRAPSRIHLRVGPQAARPLQELLTQPQVQEAFALITGLEPTADACYLWKPGQTEPTAIALAGGTGTRTCGNFLVVAPGQEQCRGILIEDGFVLTLTDAAWAELCAAIMARAPLSIPADEGMGFELSWPEVDNDRPTAYGAAGPYDA